MEYYLYLTSNNGTQVSLPNIVGGNTTLKFDVHRIFQVIYAAHGNVVVQIECVGVAIPNITGTGNLTATASYNFMLFSPRPITNHSVRNNNNTGLMPQLINVCQGIGTGTGTKYQTGVNTQCKGVYFLDNIQSITEIIIQLTSGTNMSIFPSTLTAIASTYCCMLKLTPVES